MPSSNAKTVAQELLEIHAVTLQPDHPFTWVSGLHSPIYTDNRMTISYPQVRKDIYSGMVELIKNHFKDAEVIAGVATAGIPHAAWVAEKLGLPLIYVRSKPKDHGRGKQVEGVLKPGQKVVVIDDLLSTGGSVLNAAKAVSNAGGKVIGVVADFSYQLPAAATNFAKAGIEYYTVTDYTTLVELAQEHNLITKAHLQSLHEWRKDPQAWSAKHGN